MYQTIGNVDDRDVKVITNITKELFGKVFDEKKTVIETVNDELKTICQLEHSIHRSISGFLLNMIIALAAYSFIPKNLQ